MNFLTKDWKYSNDIGLFILRIVFAFILIYGHGWEKLIVIFGSDEIQFFDPIGLGTKTSFILAGLAEGICALLLIVGLFSRYVSIIIAFNFMVIFYFHAIMSGDNFTVLEPRILYLFGFIALIFTGPGKISLDYLIFGKEE